MNRAQRRHPERFRDLEPQPDKRLAPPELEAGAELELEALELPERVPMTRRAKLITAERLRVANGEADERLQARGIVLDPAFFVERRLVALESMMLVDDDERAELELRYQELLAAALARVPEIAAAQERRALLLAPPNGAGGRILT